MYSVLRLGLAGWCSLAVLLTLLGHAHFQAFLQPAVLAAVPGHLVDDAVLLPVTRVHHVLLDAPPKEALEDRGMKKEREIGEEKEGAREKRWEERRDTLSVCV